MGKEQPFQPGDLVGGYFRDSGGDTQELSIGQQEAAFYEFCARTGLIAGAIFEDAARPGSSTIGRDGFQAMMEHFRRGAAEKGLVIWSYSRFARDFDDAAFFRADLRRRGYLLHSLNDAIPEGNMGRVFEAIVDWKNQQFLEDLSRDIKRGLGSLVREYGAVPGTPPRGFKREAIHIGKRRDGREHVAHRWVIDPETAPRVQRAFEMRAAGMSLAAINVETGLFGSLNSYATFFSNRLYIGILEFGDLVIDGYCAALVDVDTWEAVQSRRKTRMSGAQHPRRMHSNYLLSGLAYCARCGSPLFGSSHPQKSGNVWQAYRCTGQKRRRDCDLPQIPRKALERAVIETLLEYVLTPEVAAEQQRTILDNSEQHERELLARRAEIAGRLANVRRRVSNLAEAIAEQGTSRALREKLEEAEGNELRLQAELVQIDRQRDSRLDEIGEAELALAVREMVARLGGEETQAVLRGFVERIDVDREGDKVRGVVTYRSPFLLQEMKNVVI